MRSRGIRRRSAVAAAIIATGAFAGGCGSDDDGGAAGDGEGGTIKYGLISAFTGSTAVWGKAHEAAVQLGIDEVNKAGIKVGDGTYKLQLQTYDSAYDPTKAATAAQKAVTKDDVQFLENLGGGTAAAVQAVTERRDVLLVCFCGGDPFLGEEHPLTFRPYFDVPASLKASLTYLKEADPSARKLAMVYPDDDAGHTNAERSKQDARELGFEPTMYFVDRSTQDLAPLMTKVLNGKPDVIDVGPSPETLYVSVVKAASELGFDGRYIFPDTLVFGTALEATGAEALQGSLSSPCNLKPSSDVATRFSRNFEAKAGMDTIWAAAQSYDGVRLLAKAIEKAQSLDPEKVAEALPTVSVEGASGGGSPDVTYGVEINGLSRAFSVPYPVCEVERGKLTQATSGS
jgi:branched-chain amino acid transport system substrate-binding protein